MIKRIKNMKQDEVRLIKISREALFEFIYEKFMLKLLTFLISLRLILTEGISSSVLLIPRMRKVISGLFLRRLI